MFKWLLTLVPQTALVPNGLANGSEEAALALPGMNKGELTQWKR